MIPTPVLLAAALGFLPLVWLALLRVGGWRQSWSRWGMAGAFAVSGMADVLAIVGKVHFADAAFPAAVSQVYPVLQVTVFGLALIPWKYVGPLAWWAFLSLGWSLALRDAVGLDVLLYTSAAGTTAALAWKQLESGPVRWVLAIGWPLDALAWALYVTDPGGRWLWSGLTEIGINPYVGPWSLYQGVRLLVTVAWCGAIARRDASPA